MTTQDKVRILNIWKYSYKKFHVDRADHSCCFLIMHSVFVLKCSVIFVDHLRLQFWSLVCVWGVCLSPILQEATQSSVEESDETVYISYYRLYQVIFAMCFFCFFNRMLMLHRVVLDLDVFEAHVHF